MRFAMSFRSHAGTQEYRHLIELGIIQAEINRNPHLRKVSLEILSLRQRMGFDREEFAKHLSPPDFLGNEFTSFPIVLLHAAETNHLSTFKHAEEILQMVKYRSNTILGLQYMLVVLSPIAVFTTLTGIIAFTPLLLIFVDLALFGLAQIYNDKIYYILFMASFACFLLTLIYLLAPVFMAQV